MDFTREPTIETVITPKEGCKIVVRSSKGAGQEEHFVDAVEVVSFGNSVFYRSLERPKAFLVPASDYEVLEVREARMVLKNVGLDRSIKIGGGRDHAPKQHKEPTQERERERERAPAVAEAASPAASASSDEEEGAAGEAKPEGGRKRDRRRQYRRRRGKDGEEEQGEEAVEGSSPANGTAVDGVGHEKEASEQPSSRSNGSNGGVLPSILPPPPMLISETLARYKENVLFQGAFYTKEETVDAPAEVKEAPVIPQPEYGSFEASPEEEEVVYQQRTQQAFLSDEDDLVPTTHVAEELFEETDYPILEENKDVPPAK